MKTLFFRLMLVCSASLILTSCGGPAGPSKTFKVTMTDFTFSPNAFTVPAGQQISFAATNNGAVTHTFIIMKKGYQVKDHFSDADKPDIFWEAAQIVPGQSVSDTFTAPADPGEYQIVCGEAGHFEAGMLAKLIVVNQP